MIVQEHNGDYLHGELLPSDAYVGGEDVGGFTNDFNYNFSTASEAEMWYDMKYSQVWAFDDENETMEFWNEKIHLDW